MMLIFFFAISIIFYLFYIHNIFDDILFSFLKDTEYEITNFYWLVNPMNPRITLNINIKNIIGYIVFDKSKIT